MTSLRTLFLALAAVMAALPAYARSVDQDTVRDARNNYVFDSWGGCVRTKWLVDNVECGAMMANANSVYFDFNKAVIRADARHTLDGVISDILASHDVIRVDVVGHADRIGTDGYNMALSQKRANAVKRYLASAGVDSRIIITQAKGEREPVTNCSAKTNRAEQIRCLQRDRRDDIVLNGASGMHVNPTGRMPDLAPGAFKKQVE